MSSHLNQIAVKAVDLCYANKVVFKQLNIDFSAAGISFIIGENGSGKTQLLYLLHGLVQPDSGLVVAPKTQQQAFLQQTPILLNRNVGENLRFIKATAVCSARYFKANYQQVIAQFQLENILRQNVNTLSGGQRKRVAMARLFLQQADYYLLDEPAANIDHHNNLVIESALRRLLEQKKKIIIATHDFFQIRRLFTVGSDEILVLKNGQLIQRLSQPDIARLVEFF